MASTADPGSSSNGGGGPGGGGGGQPLFVMQSMQSPSERYLSNESLENDRNSTTSSTESPNSGGVVHRKDHEFIPTRQKTITASRPAADPGKFTKVPSNPLLISAQRQIMQAEEIRRRKESRERAEKAAAAAAAPASESGGFGGDSDWQGNLSSWKNRRRKQSEEALQRVAEVKALEDVENSGEPRKISMSRKLSSLLYTSGEDLDWNEMVGEDKEEEEEEEEEDQGKSDDHRSRGDSTGDREVGSRQAKKATPPPAADPPKPPPEWSPAASKVQNWTEVIRQDAAPKTSSPALPAASVTTYAQRNNAKNSIGSSWEQEQSKQQEQKISQSAGQPSRRKSSEMSATMRERLEAFKTNGEGDEGTEEGNISGGGGPKEPKTSLTAGVIEPDQKFHQKLMAFRKISEGKLDAPREPLKPKPPQSISSLLARSSSQTRASDESNEKQGNEDYENDTLDDVDQLLDDALEESYRSVLEEKSKTTSDTKMMFSDDDFANKSLMKAPPSEKPPPPPPEESSNAGPGKKGNAGGEGGDGDDDEIDQQERQIIASLEMEEREHNRYIMEQKMKRLPSNLSSNSSATINTVNGGEGVDSGLGSSAGKTTSGVGPSPVRKDSKQTAATTPSAPSASETITKNNNNYNNSHNQSHSSRKRTPNEQRTYNQHWLIQEAEQRRIAEQQQQLQRPPPPSSQPSSITTPSSNDSHQMQQHGVGDGSPFYENSQYVNQRLIPSVPSQSPQHQQQHQSNYPPPVRGPHQPPTHVPPPHVNENVYANLGSQQHPPHQQNPQPVGYQRDGRIPGPQVPPRKTPHDPPIPETNGGDRVLSVSGKKLCSHCNEELGRGAAMIIESLRLYYHLRCFKCCVCHIQLGNGAQGTDVRVRNNKLHCQNCYSNDEGLKFSKV